MGCDVPVTDAAGARSLARVRSEFQQTINESLAVSRGAESFTDNDTASSSQSGTMRRQADCALKSQKYSVSFTATAQSNRTVHSGMIRDLSACIYALFVVLNRARCLYI